MSRSPVSNPDDRALGQFQGEIERNSNFLAQARNHNLSRNMRVFRLLAYLGMMRHSGFKFPAGITCQKAVLQNFSSPESMQAAHFLPGQLRIGGLPVWQLPSQVKVGRSLAFMFAEVEHLPTPFNQADSQAEAKGGATGLCSALVAATTVLLQHPMPTADWLTPAYEEWHRQALVAFQLAEAIKGAKPRVPPLVGNRFDGYTPESIAARSSVGTTEWNREEATRILGYYLADQQDNGLQPLARTHQTLQEVALDF